MSLSIVRQLIDEALALNYSDVFFTGGEPFILDEIYDMLAYASARIETTALTNAMLLNNQRLARLCAIKNNNLTVQMSLDGARPDQHDAYRGAGSWIRTMDGIKALQQSGFHVRLATTQTPANSALLAEVCEFHRALGIPEEDHLIRPLARSGFSASGLEVGMASNPAESVAEAPLEDADRAHAAALMRVNHCGEVCAQALYQGQALASDNAELKRAHGQAAREEQDHLAWTEARIAELGGRTSLLNPLWYAGALALGFAAGKAGDAWNLAFLKETERQVEAHLAGHLDRLAVKDARTRVVIEAMQRDEIGHARTAEALGARELPWFVKSAMRAAAKVMTTVSYRV